jgi:hypothetical protein
MKTTVTERLQVQEQSAWHNLLSSAAGGSGGAYICFPFEGLKKRIQSGQPLSFYPQELFRGSVAFSISVTLATVTAMSFDRALKNMPGYDHTSLVWNSGSAVMSGMLGSVVGSTPVENIILTQQLHKTSPVNAIRIMLQQGPTRLWVGLPELAIREGGFAGVMLWGVDAARQKVLKRTNSKTKAEIAALSVGVGGATVTQPFDALATIKQKSNGLLSSTQAAQQLYASKGPLGFFSGLSQRVFLFTGCAYTIPKIQKMTSDWLNNKK